LHAGWSNRASISLNPDVAIKTHLVIADEERLLYGAEPVKSESAKVVVPKLTNESRFSAVQRWPVRATSE
jgi:hypothetical protein